MKRPIYPPLRGLERIYKRKGHKVWVLVSKREWRDGQKWVRVFRNGTSKRLSWDETSNHDWNETDYEIPIGSMSHQKGLARQWKLQFWKETRRGKNRYLQKNWKRYRKTQWKA